MRRCIIFSLLVFAGACASQKQPSTSADAGKGGDTRTKEAVLMDDLTYLLTETTTDSSYGYTQSNPVKVGGPFSEGPKNERRFLNALLGPNGEKVVYQRAGSCCAFRTPNGLMNNTGLLDHYRVSWTGSRDTVSIYVNMYDKGDLLIPVGFTAKTR